MSKPVSGGGVGMTVGAPAGGLCVPELRELGPFCYLQPLWEQACVLTQLWLPTCCPRG